MIRSVLEQLPPINRNPNLNLIPYPKQYLCGNFCDINIGSRQKRSKLKAPFGFILNVYTIWKKYKN